MIKIWLKMILIKGNTIKLGVKIYLQGYYSHPSIRGVNKRGFYVKYDNC